MQNDKDGSPMTSLPTTVLVTGASGFIGTRLVERLVANGRRVVCLDIAPPRIKILGCDYISADVRLLNSLSLPPVGEVFNLAAVHTTPGHEDHEYYDTNVFGALAVARFCEDNHVKRMVFTSSISVYGPSEEPCEEESVLRPTSAYGKSKLMAEEICRAWLRAAPDRKLTIARPAVVFGRGEGGNFERMAKLLCRGVFVFPGRRDTIKSCIFVDHLIDLILIGADTQANYELINGSYDPPPRIDEIIGKLHPYFPHARLIDVPAPLLMLLARLASTLGGFGIGLHPERILKLTRSTNIVPGWARRRGITRSQSLDQGISAWAESTSGRFR